MTRAPFQVLVLPYRHIQDSILYAIFCREASTGGYWQGIAGGGEVGETPLEAAKREAREEASVDPNSKFIALDTRAMIPRYYFSDRDWDPDILVIPEYSFAVHVTDEELSCSEEHTEYCWLDYEQATELLHWDSNKTALWELNQRLLRRGSAP